MHGFGCMDCWWMDGPTDVLTAKGLHRLGYTEELDWARSVVKKGCVFLSLFMMLFVFFFPAYLTSLTGLLAFFLPRFPFLFFSFVSFLLSLSLFPFCLVLSLFRFLGLSLFFVPCSCPRLLACMPACLFVSGSLSWQL